MKILLIDNYDSFTYNLAQLVLDTTGARPEVLRNDQVTPEQAARYDRILLSPGPGIPEEAGRMPEIIRELGPTACMLGVCLGHQAIGEAYGGTLVNLSEVHHAVSSEIRITGKDPLFAGLGDRIPVGRYHSWAVQDLPDCFEVTATDAEGTVMALRHKTYNLRGVQFHPESILTPDGKTILSNWINHCG